MSLAFNEHKYIINVDEDAYWNLFAILLFHAKLYEKILYYYENCNSSGKLQKLLNYKKNWKIGKCI